MYFELIKSYYKMLMCLIIRDAKLIELKHVLKLLTIIPTIVTIKINFKIRISIIVYLFFRVIFFIM